jgi:hypothetical protein
VQPLVAGGLSVNTANAMGRTVLHLAVAEQRSAHVPALLALGADPNAQDLWGYTPLHEAALWGEAGAVAQLAAAGAEPDLAVRRGIHQGARALDLAKHWKRRAVIAHLAPRTSPGSVRVQDRLTIPRAGAGVLLDLSAAKLPQQAALDFRTRYREPLTQASDWPYDHHGTGKPLQDYELPRWHSAYAPSLAFCRETHLPNAQDPALPRCLCCGSREGRLIYLYTGCSGNAPVSQDIIWRCELVCDRCGWYSYWDFLA